MRETRQSGLEGGVALTRHPYPYVRLGVGKCRRVRVPLWQSLMPVTESNCVTAR
jgi:hypothetical protein